MATALTNGATVTGSAEDAAKAAAISLANSGGDDVEPAKVLPGNGVSAHSDTNGADPFGGATEDEIRSARQQGWTERFRGDPKDFVTAKEFYERGLHINPILKARVGPLEEENKRLKAALANTNTRLGAFETRFTEQDREARAKRLVELKAAKVKAIEEQDGSKVVQLDDEIAKLQTPAAAPTATTTEAKADPAVVDAVTRFTRSHSDWYGIDIRRTMLTNAVAEEIKRERPDLLGKPEFFDELDVRVRKEFKLDGSPVASAAVESGDSGGPRTPTQRGRSWNDLPRDAQAVAERMIEQKLFKDKAEYLAYYDWS